MDNNRPPTEEKAISAMEALEMIYSVTIETNARLAEALDAMAVHRDVMVSEIQSIKQDVGEMKRVVSAFLSGQGQSSATVVVPSQSERPPQQNPGFKWDKREHPETPEELFKSMKVRIPNR